MRIFHRGATRPCLQAASYLPRSAAHPVMQLQRTAGNAAVARLGAGTGRALEAATRRTYEHAFGQDLSMVRVHEDSSAASSARALHARAYTIGQDIMFGEGEYSPGTPAGRRLLTHELTHVAQQTATGVLAVQRQPRKDEPEPEWQKHLDEMLPGGVGLVEDIHRITTLSETIGFDELARMVELIHGNEDAVKFVKENGVPGLIAIYDTLWATRRNVPRANVDLTAAKTLVEEFPSRMWPDKKRDPKTPKHVFSDEAVREAFVEFHRNALLDREDEQKKKIRENCIQVVKHLVPELFAAGRQRKLTKELGRLKGGTDTMPDAGAVFVKLGVADKPFDIKFKDGNGLKDAPEKMERSAFQTIVDKVGKVQGWHVFGVSVLSGFHSATVFVHNTAAGPRVFWADQWNIAQGEDFGQAPGAVSGFRLYDNAGKFDHFIEDQTHRWWTEKIHHKDSKCAERRRAKKKNDWDMFCKYPATVRIWYLRTS